MRKLRLLDDGVWYGVRTRINNREPLFRRQNALALFALVFRQAKKQFGFSVRALRLENDWLVFFIRPVDGFELPAIMKWVKQVFAQRFNGIDGRIGHVWGDRYWSEILDGEPPEELEEDIRVRPQRDYKTKNPVFLLFSPWFTAPFPRPPTPVREIMQGVLGTLRFVEPLRDRRSHGSQVQGSDLREKPEK